MAREQPVAPGRAWRLVAGRSASKASVNWRDDQVRQALARRQRIAGLGDLGRQVAGGDGDLGVRVGDVVLELLGAVHRVDRNHHRVGAQDREMRDHQLRAVLHVQHHAVALASRPAHAARRPGARPGAASSRVAGDRGRRRPAPACRDSGAALIARLSHSEVAGDGDARGAGAWARTCMRAVHAGSALARARCCTASGMAPTAVALATPGTGRRPTDCAFRLRSSITYTRSPMHRQESKRSLGRRRQDRQGPDQHRDRRAARTIPTASPAASRTTARAPTRKRSWAPRTPRCFTMAFAFALEGAASPPPPSTPRPRCAWPRTARASRSTASS